jgi:hypothetical protein
MEAVWGEEELFPVVEEKARRNSVLREWKDALDKHGPLLPRASVCFVVDLSRQRIKQLIDEGKLPVVVVHNREYMPIAVLEMFLADERKGGRPVKELTIAESFRKHLFHKAQK